MTLDFGFYEFLLDLQSSLATHSKTFQFTILLSGGQCWQRPPSNSLIRSLIYLLHPLADYTLFCTFPFKFSHSYWSEVLLCPVSSGGGKAPRVSGKQLLLHSPLSSSDRRNSIMLDDEIAPLSTTLFHLQQLLLLLQGGIDGHNRRWIDGSIPMLSIDTIGHADHR